MDTIIRTARATYGESHIIRTGSAPPVNRVYWLHNLGPSIVKLSYQASGDTGAAIEEPIPVGDFIEFQCCWANVEVVDTETVEGSIVQWAPA